MGSIAETLSEEMLGAVILSFIISVANADILTDLSSQSGAVLTPNSPGYEDRRKVMNAACTAKPAVIVVPNTDMDISIILGAARSNNMEISVRSGGHSYTCTNLKEGGVHVDMRNFNQMQLENTGLSPTGLLLRLGPGRKWGDVLEYAPPTKYSYPHGQCRSVGVGGYLLGGGVNWLGTYNKFGYGAEHILQMKVVLADGSIALVDKTSTTITYPQYKKITHTADNNLFTALRGSGSSFGIVTEFLYMIYPGPEADPAVLLAWIENEADLETIHRAAKATNDYSITVSQEFANEFWKKELTQVVYEMYPDIMNTLKAINFKSSYPVPLTVTDIRVSAQHKTDPNAAADYLKSQGVKMVFVLDIVTNVFHQFAEYLYGNNMQEQQDWEPGKYYLASLNFGSLADSSSFSDIFFNDPSFGVRRSNFLEFSTHGCDYCFWMIHYRNRQRETSIAQEVPISTRTDESLHYSLDTNIVCMFTDANADCPNIIKRVKTQIENNLSGSTYSKYANFPSCSESDWGERYWENYSKLQTMKNTWDPNNVFNHCHSVGSTNNTCCPDFEHSTSIVEQKTCVTNFGQKCVFPFKYNYKTYNSCTQSGIFGQPWCATSTNIFGVVRSWAYCNVNTCPVN